MPINRERLARAVAEADARKLDGKTNLPVLINSPRYMAVCQRIVTAILSEIAAQGYVIRPEVPTEAMVRKGAYQVSGLTHEGARCVFRAMIQAGREE